MSVKLMEMVFRLGPEIGAPERLILIAIADHANRSGECWPSMKRLAERCGLSERMARYHVRSLQDRGLIEVEIMRGRGNANRYRVTLENRQPIADFDPPKTGNPLPIKQPKNRQNPTRVNTRKTGKTGNICPENRQCIAGEPSKEPKKDITPLYPPKPKRSRSPQTDTPEFVRFWGAYPRRVGKGQARRAWATAIKKTDPETIIAAAHQVEDRQQYTPHPATWLNGERWADERMTVTRMEPNHDRPRRADPAAARASRDFGAVGWPEPRTPHADPDRGHGPGAGSYLTIRPRD